MAIAASERLFHAEDRVAVFIDGANLYQAAKALGFDIDYKRLLQTLAVDCRFIRAYYYTALLDEQEYSPIRPLVDWLDYNGYTMVTKPLKEFTQSTGRRKFKGNMDVEIAVDVMEMSRHASHIVLISGDGDFRRLVEAVQRRACVSPWCARSARSRRWSPTSCGGRRTFSSTSPICRVESPESIRLS